MPKLSEHFSSEEFACHCGRKECDAKPIRLGFVEMMEKLRARVAEILGREVPFVIVSGCRCAFWNAKVGGAPASRHLKGDAADIAAMTLEVQEAIDEAATELGFGGIGRGSTFVHVDGRPLVGGKPVRWTY